MNRKPSLIYSYPDIYQIFMYLIYRKHFESRYRVIANEIQPGESVVDVCAGNAHLYLKYLKYKSNKYIAVDNSPNFIRWIRNHKVNALLLNIREDDIPGGDVLVMMASLYQFLPNEKKVVQKMISKAIHKVIISEPISNFSSSHIKLISWFARRISVPYDSPIRYTGERFNETKLLELFKSFPTYEGSYKIPGGRELVGIFKGISKN